MRRYQIMRLAGKGLIDALGQRAHVELGAVELFVSTTPGQQLVMSPLFDDPAAFDDEDPIGRPYGRQPVSDHDGRTPCQRDGLDFAPRPRWPLAEPGPERAA